MVTKCDPIEVQNTKNIVVGFYTALPYMWVILSLVGYKLVGERLAAFARARKRSDVTRGHMWANTAPAAHFLRF